ncbi:MAG: hypothetical protein ABWY62_00900 [Acidimicrobiia bacterium]
MIRRVGMIVAWAVATVAATGIAVAAVGNVADQVVDTPPAAASADDSSASTGADTSEVIRGAATSTSNARRGTSTSNGGTATSSTNGGSVTSTSNGGTTSTTEDPTPEPTSTATYNLVGGWVTIAYGPGVVELVGAAPNSGFSIDIKENGPDRVEVEFESEDHESRVRADETSGGTPELRIEEDD